MTIYSSRAQRGKFQVLATYRLNTGGYSTDTVASVDDADTAYAIAEALSQVSWAAVHAGRPPIPADQPHMWRGWDSRVSGDHHRAITDRGARPELLHGRLSLWYTLMCLELHAALKSLDDNLQGQPSVVTAAVEAELARERAYQESYQDEDSRVDDDRDIEPLIADFASATRFGEPSKHTFHELAALERSLSSASSSQLLADLPTIHGVYMRADFDLEVQIRGDSFRLFQYDAWTKRHWASVDFEDGHWAFHVWGPEPGDSDSGGRDDDAESDTSGELTKWSETRVVSSAVETLPAADTLEMWLNRDQATLAQWAATAKGGLLAGTELVATAVAG